MSESSGDHTDSKEDHHTAEEPQVSGIKMKQMKGCPPFQAIASCFHGVRLLHCSFQTPANQCGSVPKSGSKLTAQIFPLRAEHLLTFPDEQGTGRSDLSKEIQELLTGHNFAVTAEPQDQCRQRQTCCDAIGDGFQCDPLIQEQSQQRHSPVVDQGIGYCYQ